MAQFLESVNEEEIPTFVGIKFTSSNLDEGAQAFRVNNNKFAVFLGNDQVFLIVLLNIVFNVNSVGNIQDVRLQVSGNLNGDS